MMIIIVIIIIIIIILANYKQSKRRLTQNPREKDYLGWMKAFSQVKS